MITLPRHLETTTIVYFSADHRAAALVDDALFSVAPGFSFRTGGLRGRQDEIKPPRNR